MNNGPNDAPSPGQRGRAVAQTDRGATGVSINIESDYDDNDSTTAEHDFLLPAPTSTMAHMATQTSSLHGLGQANPNTTINVEHHLNQSPTRQSSGSNNILSSFFARQRSFTPVTSTPVRLMNRRLQQSRSVGNNTSSIDESTLTSPPLSLPPSLPPPLPTPAAVASPAGVRQLDFWRVNLNEMFSLSTAPSTEALRYFIQHSNFRYQPATGAATAAITGAGAGPGAGAAPADNSHILLNDGEAASSSSNAGNNSISMRMNNSGMGRSISLREDQLQLQRPSPLGGRHNASVQGLSTLAQNQPSPPAYDETGAAAASSAALGVAAGAAVDGAGAPNVPPGGGGGNENNADDDHIITDMVVQILSHFVRYLPIICILLIKFVHDHLLGILDLLLLQTVMYNVNRSLRHQVSRLAQKNYAVLIRDMCLILVVVTVRLFMATSPPDPFGLLVPPPQNYQIVELSKPSVYHVDFDIIGDHPATTFQSSADVLKAQTANENTTTTKVIPLGMLLYYVAVSDLLLKLLTMFIKICITMLPMHMIRLKVRARLYVLVEYISQFYRSVVPISQWFIFLYESYSGLEVISGGLFSSLYIGAKIFELLERGKSLKKAITTFRRNIDSERPPTKDELDAAGTVCPICHDSYNSPIVLECGHIFCDECVQTWFKREQTCPMCRAKVSDDPAWQDGTTTFFHQLY